MIRGSRHHRCRRHRRAPIAIAIALLGIALAACSGPSRSTQAARRPATQSPNATAVSKFTPYSSAGALTVVVTGHATGQCWTGSIVVAVPGVYRCLVGNDIADPCFTPPQPAKPTTVACLPDPWSGALVVTLTAPLPITPPVGHAANPWALQLANGVRCVASGGTVHSVDGVSLNLQCSGGTAAGGLDTTGPMWQVKYGPQSGGPLAVVGVTHAWQG
ncbi:MAG: hypothetical protein ABI808_09330 [Pseudonocardiales bacterium]